MSLLHNFLKPSQHPEVSADSPLPVTSKRSVKRYAASITSSDSEGASMHSIAESMMSFYHVITGGGTHVPKRRRPDISKLGVPEWYAENPPPAPLLPGTAAASPAPAFTSAHASVLHPLSEEDKPWLGLVLYSHAHPESAMAMYHTAATVTGEVRVVLDAPANLGSIDVWVVIASDSNNDNFKPPMASLTVNVWNRKKGDPKYPTPGGPSFTGQFPAGSFVFPFEFLLPMDTLVKHPDEIKTKNLARVPLPPSYYVSMTSRFWGSVKYIAGVNVVREGFGTIDDEFDQEFQYLPLCKPLPRVKTPFPHLPTREDWPFTREVVGGWTLTPFGGRGRLQDEAVEVEGILGVQEPAVYTAGQMLEFSLLLWSANPRALEALGQPGAIEVGFCKADVFALNALDPRTDSRRDRYTSQLAAGRIWRTHDGRPADDAPVPKVQMLELPDVPAHTHSPLHKASPLGPLSGASHEWHHLKGAMPSRMQEVHASNDEDEDATLADHTASMHLGGESDSGTHRPPSPTPSLEDLDADDSHQVHHFARLDGEVRVPVCSHPSFRYTNMGREYYLSLIIRHPQYSHISPSDTTGIVAECPVLYVLDRFAHLPPHPEAAGKQDFALSGTAVSLGPDVVRAPVSVGALTEQRRPTSKFQRMR
ncbi:hypothetical protein B0H19DRAFT_99700 [Mycena capillaripes]|nr:hypothetical protein B0H19DRAFT_99700 [Mycena capillaripes]